MPIQECEWDTPGGFTNGGPGDSHLRVPRSLFLSMNYGHSPGSAVPIGEIGGGRERPPLFASRIGILAGAVFTRVTSPGGSLPSYSSLREGPFDDARKPIVALKGIHSPTGHNMVYVLLQAKSSLMVRSKNEDSPRLPERHRQAPRRSGKGFHRDQDAGGILIRTIVEVFE